MSLAFKNSFSCGCRDLPGPSLYKPQHGLSPYPSSSSLSPYSLIQCSRKYASCVGSTCTTTGMFSYPAPLSIPALIKKISSLIYCSDDCQNRDISSPSISSSSSALSSPHLSYAPGGEVPALVPSALGSALRNYRERDHYSVSSSSVSSTSFSVTTDDEDDGPLLSSEHGFYEGVDPVFDGSSKSAGYAFPSAMFRHSALFYTRRPSGTNNRSTVPNPTTKRKSSASSSHASSHVRGIPRSAPIHSLSSTEDEEAFSDFGFSSRDSTDADEIENNRDITQEDGEPKSSTASTVKSKRSRNRASLPPYFSLLQMTSTEVHSPPMSSSSGHTIARPSPPTPKSVLSTDFHQSIIGSIVPLASTTHGTPRGRRQVPDDRSSRRSGHSESASRSHSRPKAAAVEHSPLVFTERPLRTRLDSRSTLGLSDWSSMPGLAPRGRPLMRRNSSPPPKVQMVGRDEYARVLAAVKNAESLEAEVSKSRSRSRPRVRGRARVDELEGVGSFAEAPGYGNGRSGLLNRGRTGHSMRVPL